MTTYFVCSDIHGFYKEWMHSLKKAGFEKDNSEHILIILGDIFDRGHETINTFNFIMSLPKQRVILVRGNHENLFLSLLEKDFPESHDFSNRTVSTFCEIAGYDEELLDREYWIIKAIWEDKDIEEYSQFPFVIWNIVRNKVAKHKITKFLKSNRWINYYEMKDYIFVHSWIPCATKSSNDGSPEEIGYREDWRNATQTEWDDATWGCPWKKALYGWNRTGKTIVCGHWHTSDFFIHLTKQRKNISNCPIFKSKRYKLIGLDACTALTKRVNVLKIVDKSEEETARAIEMVLEAYNNHMNGGKMYTTEEVASMIEKNIK